MSEVKERSYCSEIKSIVDGFDLNLHCTVDSIIRGSRRSPDVIGIIPISTDVVSHKNYWGSIDSLIASIEEFNPNESNLNINKVIFDGKEISLCQKELMEIRTIKQSDLKTFPKWGVLLRAPAIYFKIIERGTELIAPLSECGFSIRRGYTTNANELYYLPSRHWKITDESSEKLTIRYSEQPLVINKKYLRKLIKSPQDLKKYTVEDSDSSTWILFLHETRSDYEEDSESRDLLVYIDWMKEFISHAYLDNRKFPSLVEKLFNPELQKRISNLGKREIRRQKRQILREICRQFLRNQQSVSINEDFFKLSFRESAEFLTSHGVNQRFTFWDNECRTLEDARLYGVQIKNEVEQELVGACLNLTFTYLGIELMGRTNLGGGALDVKVIDYKKVPIFNPKKIPVEFVEGIKKAYGQLKRREILPISEEVQQEDRKILDKIFLTKILGMEENDISELYEGLEELIENRLTRAKST